MQFEFPPGATSAPPTGFLLVSSIHSAHFHSRNPSASYQLGSLSQGRRHLPVATESWTPEATFAQCGLDLHVDKGNSMESDEDPIF